MQITIVVLIALVTAQNADGSDGEISWIARLGVVCHSYVT